jgi:DGQHR domain-containing protein
MPPIPPPRPIIHASPEFDFIAGRYADSSSPVAYFVTVMKYREAASSLRLVSDLPGSSALDWKIEELYQREVDWNRVNRRIIPYLRQANAPQFFNAITVALLPQVGGRISGMTEQGWAAPPLKDAEQFSAGCIKTLGPITCGYWGDWTDPNDDSARLGRITWNLDQVAAVAIDGQHRLAAIKALQDGNPNSNSAVPVILVVAHPLLGVEAGGDGISSVGITRRLFIDLNKHAVKVSRARQILLDDHDPVSICTRSLVGSSLCLGDGDFAQGRLPLTAVDWHSEQAKFDSGPYITTILGLDWLVSQCLGVPPFVDSMNYDAVQKMLDAVTDSLGVGLEDAQRRLDEARESESPFEFVGEDDASELARIRTGFSQSWAPAILELFKGLRPYASLLELRLADKSLSPEFASWWVAKSRRDSASPGPAGMALRRVEEELRLRREPGVAPRHFEELISRYTALKSERELAFSVAFQRALFLAFNRFLRARIPLAAVEDIPDVFGPDDACESGATSVPAAIGESRRLNAVFFVEAINLVAESISDFYSREMLFGAHPQRRFWAHSLLRESDDSIDFTGAASARASDLIIAAVYIHLLRTQTTRRVSFDSFWQSVEEAGAGDGVHLRLKQAVDRMARDTGLGGKIAAAKEPPILDPVTISVAAREEVKLRMSAIWKALSR